MQSNWLHLHGTIDTSCSHSKILQFPHSSSIDRWWPSHNKASLSKENSPLSFSSSCSFSLTLMVSRETCFLHECIGPSAFQHQLRPCCCFHQHLTVPFPKFIWCSGWSSLAQQCIVLCQPSACTSCGYELTADCPWFHYPAEFIVFITAIVVHIQWVS